MLNLVKAFHQSEQIIPPSSSFDNKRFTFLTSNLLLVSTTLNIVTSLNFPLAGGSSGVVWVSDFQTELETGIPSSPCGPAGPGSPCNPTPGNPWGPSAPVLEYAILYSIFVLLTIDNGPATFDNVAFCLSIEISGVNILSNL